MYNQIERELKCLLDPEQYEFILNSYDFPIKIHQNNTYYDTIDGCLKNRQSAMRIRTIDSKYIFTLKIRTDDITLIELEKEVQDNKIEHAFEDQEIANWIQIHSIPTDVIKTVDFSTERKIQPLENAELCLDQTNFYGHIDYEIEYEYTKEHDGIAEFNRILHPFHMEYIKNCPSKVARAVQFKD